MKNVVALYDMWGGSGSMQNTPMGCGSHLPTKQTPFRELSKINTNIICKSTYINNKQYKSIQNHTNRSKSI